MMESVRLFCPAPRFARDGSFPMLGDALSSRAVRVRSSAADL
jgi:hypothetical protein